MIRGLVSCLIETDLREDTSCSSASHVLILVSINTNWRELLLGAYTSFLMPSRHVSTGIKLWENDNFYQIYPTSSNLFRMSNFNGHFAIALECKISWIMYFSFDLYIPFSIFYPKTVLKSTLNQEPPCILLADEVLLRMKGK